MRTYTLSAEKSALYDSGDIAWHQLRRDLIRKFGNTDTDVCHIEGFVILAFRKDPRHD
jgi:hypothetical protein